MSQKSLAEQIWKINWQEYLPFQLSPSVSLESVSSDEGFAFIADYFPLIFEQESDHRFFETEGCKSSKNLYYKTVGDFFIFKDRDKPVGMAVGSLLDWSSYNFRNIAILPEYQGQKLYYTFFQWISSILAQHGVKRIEGDIAPSNTRHLQVVNSMGYIMTSMTLSERWGALVHVTKYLDKSDEERFQELFCITHLSDKKQKSQLAG